jgi:hypothetical protein
MKKMLWILLPMLMSWPIAANAEVYKWKDKDGVIRYSDIPPPADAQKLPMHGKKPAGATAAPAEAAAAAPDPAKPTPPAGTADAKKKPAGSLEGEAIKRQEKAEADKKKAEQEAADLKLKQENCSIAKSKLNTYKQGGRIHKMSETGEREYLSAADINAGLEEAQQEVEKYCE